MADEELRIVFIGDDDLSGGGATAGSTGASDDRGLREMADALRLRIESATQESRPIGGDGGSLVGGSQSVVEALGKRIEAATEAMSVHLESTRAATVQEMDAIKRLMDATRETVESTRGATAEEIAGLKQLMAVTKEVVEGTRGATSQELESVKRLMEVTRPKVADSAEKRGAGAEALGASRGMTEQELVALKALQAGGNDKVASKLEKMLGLDHVEKRAKATLGVDVKEEKGRYDGILGKLSERIESLRGASGRIGAAAGYGGVEGGVAAGGVAALGMAASRFPVIGAAMAVIGAAGEMLAASVKATADQIRAAGAKAAVEVGSNDLIRGEIIRLQQHQKGRSWLGPAAYVNQNYRQVEVHIAKLEAVSAVMQANMGRITNVGRYSGDSATAIAMAKVAGVRNNIAEANLMGGKYAEYTAAKAQFDQAQQMKVTLEKMMTMGQESKAQRDQAAETARELAGLVKANEKRIQDQAKKDLAKEKDEAKRDEIRKKMLGELTRLREYAEKKDKPESLFQEVLKIFEFEAPEFNAGDDPVVGGAAARAGVGMGAPFAVP